MKLLSALVFSLVLVFLPVLPVLAQAPDAKGKAAVEEKSTITSLSFSGSGLGAGIGAAFTIVGAGYGFGKIGAAALESMARQPEVAGRVQTAMLIIAALLEGATFFSLIICIIVAGKATL